MPSDPRARSGEQLGKAEWPSAAEVVVNHPSAWTSDELLQGQHEVLIRHGAETYRLRLTRQGKLILHK